MILLSRRWALVLSAVVGLACAAPTRRAADPKRDRPNIVFILADDVGVEAFGSYGGMSYRTPHIDGLARSGVQFERAYAQPLCTPTRLQVMTGKYNFRNWKAFGILDPKEKTIAHYMKEAGYKTCIAGKWQLYSYDPPDRPEWRGKGTSLEESGFHEHFVWHAGHTEDKGSRYADPTILDNGRLRERIAGAYGPDLFAGYIQNFIERHRDQPFFVYYSMVLPHDPFVPTPDSEDWKDPEKRQVQRGKRYPDTLGAMGKNAGRAKYFADMVAYIDKNVGRLLGTLDRLGLRERTLVVFLSDNGTHQGINSVRHGRPIRGGKGLTTNAGIHVPLVARWPGTIAPGRISDDIVDSTDILPTLLEAAGAASPPGIDGRSFLPQLRGERGKPRQWAFFHHDPRPGIDKEQFTLERLVLDKRFKLYEDGRLYDMDSDPHQERPFAAGEGGAEAEAARARLGRVFDTLK
jgi:arylsulfatase A